MACDEGEARLGHPCPIAVEECQLPDGREHRALVDHLLDAMQDRFTLPFELRRRTTRDSASMACRRSAASSGSGAAAVSRADAFVIESLIQDSCLLLSERLEGKLLSAHTRLEHEA